MMAAVTVDGILMASMIIGEEISEEISEDCMLRFARCFLQADDRV